MLLVRMYWMSILYSSVEIHNSELINYLAILIKYIVKTSVLSKDEGVTIKDFHIYMHR